MAKNLVDPETGEIYNDVAVLYTQEQINKHNQKKKEKEKIEKEILKHIDEVSNNKNQKKFVAGFNKELENLFEHEKFTVEVAGAAFKLMLNINMNSNGRLEKNGKPMEAKDCLEVIGLGNTQSRKYLGILTSEEINFIRVDREVYPYQYYVNERFHTMGKKIKDIKFTKIFKEQTKKLIENVSIRHLGLLYMFSPFFHYQTGYLCRNKGDIRLDKNKSFIENWFNGTIKKIEHYTEEEIARLSKKSVDTIERYMSELEKENLIKYNFSGGVYNITIRPDIIMNIDTRRKNIDYDYHAFLLGQFRVLDEQKKDMMNKKSKDENKDKKPKSKALTIKQKRVLLLKQLLLENPKYTELELAGKLDVSERTIHRYLKEL